MDWSAQLCEQASLDDLDDNALQKARQEYLVKFPAKTAEVQSWDAITFLNKTGLAIHGKITNSALLLLGRPESATLLSPAMGRIT